MMITLGRLDANGAKSSTHNNNSLFANMLDIAIDCCEHLMRLDRCGELRLLFGHLGSSDNDRSLRTNGLSQIEACLRRQQFNNNAILCVVGTASVALRYIGIAIGRANSF